MKMNGPFMDLLLQWLCQWGLPHGKKDNESAFFCPWHPCHVCLLINDFSDGYYVHILAFNTPGGLSWETGNNRNESNTTAASIDRVGILRSPKAFICCYKTLKVLSAGGSGCSTCT